MYLSLITLLLAAFQVTAQQYSFTLYNRDAAKNKSADVRTWLSFEGPRKVVTHFTFGALNNSSNFKPLKVSGNSSASVPKLTPQKGASVRHLMALSRRKSTEKYSRNISQKQYKSVLNAVDAFNSQGKIFSLRPNGPNKTFLANTFNDVTACHKILAAGDVYLLIPIG